VRQLLEYKAFKDAADDLRVAAAQQSLRFPHRPVERAAEQNTKDLEEVQLWDLLEAFNGLMTAIGHSAGEAEIIFDDTPVEMHAADILDRLRDEGNLTFRQIFAGRTNRTELVGLFLALLELARRRAVFLEQEHPLGEISVFLNPNPPPGPEEAAEAAPQPAEAQAEPDPPGEAPPPADAEPSHERGSEDQVDGP
jgi:segregation and condensation protein A